MTNWIHVDEQLPPADTAVFLHVPDHPDPVWVGFWDEEEGWLYDCGAECSPEHWMPLPEPPPVINEVETT
jgi:hypothetical protein